MVSMHVDSEEECGSISHCLAAKVTQFSMLVTVSQQITFDELHRSQPRQYCIFAHIRRFSCMLAAVLVALIGTESIFESQGQLRREPIRQCLRLLDRMSPANADDYRSH